MPPSTAVEGLNLSGSQWVTIGLDGLRTDDGTTLWPSGGLFDKAVARDRVGGLVFIDGTSLWWYEAGAAQPTVVASDVPTRVIEVANTDSDLVGVLGYEERTYVRLSDGTEVADPGGAVNLDADGNEVWSADSGWFVWLEGPQLEPASEGPPTVVESPARLKIADPEGAIVVDTIVGTEAQPWVRIHDFDGRMLILSRGPIEPAMPEETYLVIDLGCDSCTSTFTLAASSASLVGADSDWNGPLMFSESSVSVGG